MSSVCLFKNWQAPGSYDGCGNGSVYHEFSMLGRDEGGGGCEFDEMKQVMIHNSVNCIIFLRVRRFFTFVILLPATVPNQKRSS